MNLRTFLGFSPPVQLALPLAPPTPVREWPAALAKPVTALPTLSAQAIQASDSEGLQDALRALLREPAVVEVHDNRSTMVSFRRQAGALRIRLHHMFLPPDPQLPSVLAGFIAGRGTRRAQASRWLDGWIKGHQSEIRAGQPPALAARTGRAHDLAAIFAALNARFFDNAIEADIGWGRAPTKRRRRTIKMGVYLHDHRQIRIHPALDHADVPDYFVAFVVYHEMCHQICPPEPSGRGRARVHTPRFRERERCYPDRDRALAWEKTHLGKLLRRS